MLWYGIGALKRIKYSRTEYTTFVHPGTCHEINNIRMITIIKTLFLPSKKRSSGRRVILQPDQTSIHWIMNKSLTFTHPGELAVNPYAGTFSVEITCMLLSNHSWCVDGDVYNNRVECVWEQTSRSFRSSVTQR